MFVLSLGLAFVQKVNQFTYYYYALLKMFTNWLDKQAIWTLLFIVVHIVLHSVLGTPHKWILKTIYTAVYSKMFNT